MFAKSRSLIAIATFTIAIFGCEKKSPPAENPASIPSAPSPSQAVEIKEHTPAALLAALHHASQEMALDGFQFDRAELGWPRDRESATARDHLEALVHHGYLFESDLPRFMEIDIANLSDSDPGETAFAKIQFRGEILVIRKDGLIASPPDSAPPPSTDPAWLPR